MSGVCVTVGDDVVLGELVGGGIAAGDVAVDVGVVEAVGLISCVGAVGGEERAPDSQAARNKAISGNSGTSILIVDPRRDSNYQS